MAVTHNINSATIGVTEFFLMANSTTKALSTTDGILQAFINFANLQSGSPSDQYQVKCYREINNVETSWLIGVVTGTQTSPMVIPALIVGSANGAWDVSVQKLAGTDRSIGWDLSMVT